jgi:serine/threonine-protein kinase RsbW
VQITVHLDLPRDARYVPLMRNVSECLLSDLGAPRAAIDDIQVALSEACANVVRHASGTRNYRVKLSVQEGGCDIEVSDSGPGFDELPAGQVGDLTALSAVDSDDTALSAESGRGLRLMQALVDDLFVVRREGDNVVRLHKSWPPLDLSIGALEAARSAHRQTHHAPD